METQSLVCPSHKKEYAGMFLAGMLVGAGILFVYVKQMPTDNSSYQAGFNAAKSLVEKSNLSGFVNTPNDIRTLTGTVTAINGTSFTLHTVSSNPFDDQALNDRTVLINPTTKIVTLSAKDPDVFKGEMESFSKTNKGTPLVMSKNRNEVSLVTPPQPFVQIPVDFSVIKTGDAITVFSSENIKTTKEFTASMVAIQPKAQPNRSATIPTGL